MNRFLIFTLLVLCLIGCDIENPFTSEEHTETESQSADEVADTEIPTVNVVYPVTTCPNPNNSWELVATLERNPLQPHQFMCQTEKSNTSPISPMSSMVRSQRESILFLLSRGNTTSIRYNSICYNPRHRFLKADLDHVLRDMLILRFFGGNSQAMTHGIAPHTLD